MRKASWQKVINIFLIAVLILPTSAAHLFVPTAHAEESEDETGWTTISDGGNEVNELAEVDGKDYVRLGTGEGNGNADADAAYFQEDGVEGSDEGTLTYTFTPETEGDKSRVSFLPYYQDNNNYTLIGYDTSSGWFQEYKYNGEEAYASLNKTDLPEEGESYELVIDYDGLDTEVSLDGESFASFTFDEKAEGLVGNAPGIRLGHWGDENSQILIQTDLEDDGSEGDDGDNGDNGNDGNDGNDGDDGDNGDGDEDEDTPEGDKQAGDFKVISENGSLSLNDDGESVTFHSDGTAKNKIVYQDLELEAGTFEADITPDRDLTRFGMIYRVQDVDTFKFAGTGDANNAYFAEVFGPANSYTGMTNGPALEADETYRMKIKFNGDNVTLYIDDEKINSWSQSDGVSDAGQIGFEKSRGDANIEIANVEVTPYDAPEKPETPEDLDTISSDEMEVTIDKVFPRISSYEVNGKTLIGQTESAYGLKVNGLTMYPEVKYEKVSENEAVYTLEVENPLEEFAATFTLSVKVEGKNAYYDFTNIESHGKENIETFNFVDLNLASVTSDETDAGGKFSVFSGDTVKTGDSEITVDEDLEAGRTAHYVGVISNDDLAATMWTSSEVDGYGNVIADRHETEDGVKALGIQSNDLFYHRSFMDQPSSNKAQIKIAIAEDENDDGKVDWQDGAIVYRDIMHEIKGASDVNNLLGTRIAMNFGSQAQQPFLKTLDNIKKVSLATDGLGQAVILKGYGNEGHDSAHPDYGDVGERMGGEDDINLLIDEAHKLNTEIGVHINAQETYPEADAFNDDFIEGPGSLGWGWIDQAYVIDKIKDLASGTRQTRLDELDAAVPGLDFVYLDVWYQDQWESNRIVEQFYNMDLRLATEFGTAMPNHATWTHWATDKNYGGKESKGINSDLMRFISNHQKDSFVLNEPEFGGTADNPLLGGAELAGFEGWQSDKNFDNFMHMTFNTNIATKFLQKYYVTNWETVEGDRAETNLEKEIKLADPNGKDEVVVTRKDDSRERIVTLNDNVVLDGDTYLIPWKEEDFSGNSGDFEKLYHWNLEGGETTWTLPEELQNVESVNVYPLTDQGRGEGEAVQVVEGQVTLTADAATPYVVIFDGAEGPEVTEWSTGAHVYDTGFNSGTIDDEFTSVEGDDAAVSVKRTDQTDSNRNLSSGDYYLNIDNPAEDTGVTREITGLTPGEDYVAEVYVENTGNEKASIQVTDAEEDVENYTLKSTQKNYVKADSHASNDGYDSKMQRMQVSFTAESDTATLTLHREAGEGVTKFDDIRIVEKSLDNQKSKNVFEQDFETVVQGIYPFVIGNTEGVEDNRIHLSEKNAPYTQKGWEDNLVDDVIDGDWSIKVNTANPGLLFRTIPQHLRFDAGEEYKVSFDYQTSGEHIRVISGDEEIDVRDIDQAKGLEINEQLEASTDTKRVELTIEGSENGQTYLGIFSDGGNHDGHTKDGVFILDNLRVEKVDDTEVVTAPVTVNYETTDGETLDSKDLGEVEVGTEAEVEALEFDGYTLVEEPEDTTVVEGDNVFTFVYEKDEEGTDPDPDPEMASVTVNYVTTDGEELDSKDLGELEVGTEAELEELTFDGYTLVQSPEDTTVAEGDNVFTFVYEKDEEGTDPDPDPEVDTASVTVEYVTTDGKELDTKDLGEVEIGTEAKVEALDFKGYTLVEEPKDTTVVEGDNVFTFVYEKEATSGGDGEDNGTENPSVEPGDDDKDEDGNPLPETATDMFNWLMAGIALLVIGGMVLIFRRRQSA